MKKQAKKKAAKGAPQKKARTLYIAAGATGYIVHPGRPLPPALQKIVEARAHVIAEDMVAEAKAGGTIIYLHGKKRAYKIADGEPLPLEVQQIVDEKAKKLANEMAEKMVKDYEEQRHRANQCQRAMTPDEIVGAMWKLIEYQGDDSQNMIMGTLFKRLKRKRKTDLDSHARTLRDATENLQRMGEAYADLQNIERGNFTILY